MTVDPDVYRNTYVKVPRLHVMVTVRRVAWPVNAPDDDDLSLFEVQVTRTGTPLQHRRVKGVKHAIELHDEWVRAWQAQDETVASLYEELCAADPHCVEGDDGWDPREDLPTVAERNPGLWS